MDVGTLVVYSIVSFILGCLAGIIIVIWSDHQVRISVRDYNQWVEANINRI